LSAFVSSAVGAGSAPRFAQGAKSASPMPKTRGR
jgi:hypothetical protein